MKGSLTYLLLLTIIFMVSRARETINVPIYKRRPTRRAAAPAALRKEGNLPNSTTIVALQQYIFGPLYLGSNKQQMNVMYDTGSPWLWVNGVDCPSCDGFGMRTPYDGAQSSDFTKTNEEISYAYGIGETLGYKAKDTVGFDDKLFVKSFPFGVATRVLDSADMAEANGICGLGFGGKSVPTVLDGLKSQHRIQEKLFSMMISYHETGNSRLIIGGVDNQLIDATKSFYSFNLKSPVQEWMTSISSITEHGTDRTIKSNVHNTVVFDTGTSHIILDSGSFENLKKTLAHRGLECEVHSGFDLECVVPDAVLKKHDINGQDDFNEKVGQIFPSLNITIQSQSFLLEAEYYMHKCEVSGGSVHCHLLVAVFDIDTLILGDPLFRKYYVVFYQDRNQIMLFHAKRDEDKDVTLRSKPIQQSSWASWWPF